MPQYATQPPGKQHYAQHCRRRQCKAVTGRHTRTHHQHPNHRPAQGAQRLGSPTHRMRCGTHHAHDECTGDRITGEHRRSQQHVHACDHHCGQPPVHQQPPAKPTDQSRQQYKMAAGYGHQVHDSRFAEPVFKYVRIRGVNRHGLRIRADIILPKYTHRQSRHQHTTLIGQLLGNHEKLLLHAGYQRIM